MDLAYLFPQLGAICLGAIWIMSVLYVLMFAAAKAHQHFKNKKRDRYTEIAK